jgi:hypothetical protein
MTARRKAAGGAKRVALYLQVSTAEQTTANQRRQLKAVAARHGRTVVRGFEDAGARPLPAGVNRMPLPAAAGQGLPRARRVRAALQRELPARAAVGT